jgi:hypothetical protein
VTEDLDSINPCYVQLNLGLKKMRNMVVYDKFNNFGKVVKNSYGPIITSRGAFAVF